MQKLSSLPVDTGALRVNITDENGIPIDADVQIYEASGSENLIDEVNTSSDGQTDIIELPAPPMELSEEPGSIRPYGIYDLLVTAPGYSPVTINGTNIFSGILSIQNVVLSTSPEVINIGPNVLYGDYAPKIPESEVKPLSQSDEIVLNEVVVPEFVVVHDGLPSDSSAKNYTVPFTSYIKNVASSEIYPTWPRETLIANVIAITSFTLNRVYTEWYRNKGYYFTITSSTAYDHKWIYDRNIFDTISDVVDEFFARYVSRPGIKQPLLTQYCDGKKTTCSGLSQWGSKALGDAGRSASQILKNYYGSEVYINTAEEIEGIPVSYPGYTLEVGSSGAPVRTIQEQLTLIRRTYSGIPALQVDGIYGPATEASVRKFQEIFDMPASGVVDYATWYKISGIYVALAKLAT